MKIKNLLIKNFRGIQRAEASDLGDTIIIAGQNGSGKSCVFDAIRFLKSTYGGYQQNEWQHFFGEFQIQMQGSATNLGGLFNDVTKPVWIEAEFQLRDREKSYISANGIALLKETIWQSVLPEAFQYGGWHKAQFSAQFRDRQPEVDKRTAEALPILMQELANDIVRGRIQVSGGGEFEIESSTLLNVIFTTYRPREIGVLDFHGAQRHYGRETVQA